MTTITDPEEYPSNDTEGKVVKTVTIPGQEGKQIKIEAWSLKLANEKISVKSTATVSIEYEEYGDKKGIDVASWYTNSIAYMALTYSKYAYTAPNGKDVILRWKLKTGDKKYAAKMKDAAYTYSLVDVEVPVEPVTKWMIVIPCDSEDTANKILDGLDEEVKKTCEIYIQKV